MIALKKLNKGELLSKNEIQKILNNARSTYQYAKFMFSNGLYVIITYNKDLTISIATNSRDLGLYNEIKSMQNVYTQVRLIDFLYRWIQKLNK